MANEKLALSVVTNLNPATKAIQKLNTELEKTVAVSNRAAAALKRVNFGKIGRDVSNTGRSIKQASSHAKSATGAFSKLASSIKRIAFYRAIRSAIKAVGQAFREGTNNLYYYSQALNNLDSAHAVQTMNGFATTALYVKNSLGAMLMPVLESLLPIVNTIAEAFVNAANAVNQFFHALKGEVTFTKAKKYATDYADALGGASGKAKELKKQVFGFDELNIFNSPSSGGGGSSDALDYTKMFEEADVSPLMQQIRDLIESSEWEQLGSLLAERVNDVVKRFDAASFGKRIGQKIQAGIGLAYGFVTGIDFGQIGEKLATALNNLLGEISTEKLGATVGSLFVGAIEFGVGFLTTFDFAAAVNKIGDFFVGLFDTLSDWIETIDWVTVGKTFFDKVYEFVTGIDFGTVARSFFELFGAALGAAWDAAKGIVSGLFTKVSDYFKEKADECGGNTFLGFLKGITEAVAGIFGWIVDNIWTPFWSGLLEAFGIDAGVSSNMQEIGKAAIDGLFEGMTAAWKPIAEWIDRIAKGVKNTFNSIIEGVKGVKPDTPRLLDWGKPTYYADGGMPKTGSLFWAGEAGAELVGQVGGRTTVTNQDQFTAGMWDVMDNTNSVILQAAQTLVQAIQSKPVPSFQIGDRDIVRAYDRGKTLAGGSLVK